MLVFMSAYCNIQLNALYSKTVSTIIIYINDYNTISKLIINKAYKYIIVNHK